MSVQIHIQRMVEDDDLPSDADFEHWAGAAAVHCDAHAEMVIRIVDEAEMQALNREYRGKDSATNVLSFVFDGPPQIQSSYLGDLVICAPVVKLEAQQQNKLPDHHWAHMVVHGVLHLQGFDHQTREQAEVMEGWEKKILAEFAIHDPYQESFLTHG